MHSLTRLTLTGVIAFSLFLPAQTTTTATFLQAVSTGVVSFSLNQTAQLNVVNLNPVAGTTGNTATICTVELQFVDGQNNMLKQVTINNVAPGASASLSLNRSEAPNLSVPRFAIRGIVRTNPLSATPGVTAIPMGVGCPVMTTLEIYNQDTGNTQLVTSDVRSISTGILPLIATPR